MSRTKRSKAHKVLNEKMARFVPELASEYALCPLEYSRWKAPEEIHEPTGAPCFISSSSPDLTYDGIRMNYVFCRKKGDLAAGYYHICTQEAYKALYARLCQEGAPGVSCCCFRVGKARKEYTDFMKVKTIVYNRSISSEPNDVLAAQRTVMQSSANLEKLDKGRDAAYLPVITRRIASSILLGVEIAIQTICMSR